MPAVTVAACLTMGLASPPPAWAQQSAPGFEVERIPWVGSIEPGEDVTVLNRFGSIRARFGGYEGRVELLANLQHFAAEGPRLAVETTPVPGGLEIAVGFRASGDGGLVTERDPEQKKRADLVVFMPRGGTLSATTDHGLLEIKGMESDLRATSSSGKIQVREVGGNLDLTSDDGDILVVLEAESSDREQSIASSEGDLTVIFGDKASYDVTVATSGPISTDFSLDLDYRADRRPRKLGRAAIGKGATRLALSSAEGHIRLVRRPAAHRARVRDP